MMAWQSLASAGPDPLAIKDLKIYPLREPDSGRSYSLARVEARSGLIGWGECGGAIAPGEAYADQVETALDAVADAMRASLDLDRILTIATAGFA